MALLSATLTIVLLSQLLEQLVSSLVQLLLELELAIISVNHAFIAAFDLLFNNGLRLLKLHVPLLQLSQHLVQVLLPHIPAVSVLHVELLVFLVQLPLEQLVVDAVDDQIFELPQILDI